jgi:hypothetical protein
VEATRTALANYTAHLHGVIVLSKGWYLYQVARQPQASPRVKLFSDNALMRFTRNMMSSISSMHMGTAVMHRYLASGEDGDEEVRLHSSSGMNAEITRSGS